MENILKEVRHNKDFVNFYKKARDYKNSEEFKKKEDEKNNAVKAAVKNQVALIIRNYLNNDKKEGLDVENPKLVVNIAQLDECDVKCICDVLKEKGYSCKVENQRLIIEPVKEEPVQQPVEQQPVQQQPVQQQPVQQQPVQQQQPVEQQQPVQQQPVQQ